MTYRLEVAVLFCLYNRGFLDMNNPAYPLFLTAFISHFVYEEMALYWKQKNDIITTENRLGDNYATDNAKPDGTIYS